MIRQESRARRIFACLGDPSRFQLIARLAIRERCVTDLAREVGLSQSCTTRHLQALQREGLVSGVRSGKKVLFRICLEEPMVAGLVSWAIDHPPALDHVHAASDSEPRLREASAFSQATEAPVALDETRPARPTGGGTDDEGTRPARVARRPIEDFLL